MPRKKTYEEVKNFIEVKSKSGCELISNDYVKNSALLEIKCECNNLFSVSYNSFQQGKQQCNECSNINKHNKIYNQKRINKIIKLYKEGYKLKEISKIVGVKSNYISNILKNNNVKIKSMSDYYTSEQIATNKKYNFNKDYFENINTNEKAYWLGFLYADGCVYIKKNKNNSSKGAQIEISLKAEDGYHLHNFIYSLNGNIPIRNKKVKLNGKTYEACRLDINSIKMANDLIKHGCVEKKSLILDFPNDLNDEFISHFIRGYIDGDGCIAFYTYKLTDSFHVSILGTSNFLIGIKNILENNNIKCSNIKPEKSKAFHLNIYGQNNLVNLFNYLYKDAEVFLGRKYDKFKNALLYFKKDFNISETAKICTLLFDEDLQNKIYYKNKIRSNIRA